MESRKLIAAIFFFFFFKEHDALQWNDQKLTQSLLQQMEFAHLWKDICFAKINFSGPNQL